MTDGERQQEYQREYFKTISADPERKEARNKYQREWKRTARQNPEYHKYELEYQNRWRGADKERRPEVYEEQNRKKLDRYYNDDLFKESVRAYGKKRYAVKQSMVANIKTGIGCQSCGRTDFHCSVYDFHHIDPSLKDTHVPPQSLSWNRLCTEVSKCLVLCSNCHREFHAGVRSLDGLESHYTFDELVAMADTFRGN